MQKFKFALCFALVIVAFCVFSGCSHNATFAASGKVFCLNETGLTYVNGRMIFDSSRENSHLRAEFSDADSVAQAAGGNLNSLASVEKITGKQVTGYLAEVNESNPDAVKKYMSDCPMAEKDAMSVSPVTPLEPKQAPAASGQQAASKQTREDAEEAEPLDVSALTEGLKDIAGNLTSNLTGSVATVACWMPVAKAKVAARDSGKRLLILNARSTCTNCAAVYNAHQTEDFNDFCDRHGIVVCKYYEDGFGPLPYEVGLPGFILASANTDADDSADLSASQIQVIKIWAALPDPAKTMAEISGK